MSYGHWYLAAFALLIVAILVVSSRRRILRRKRIEELAARHGFRFDKKTTAAELPVTNALPLFESGSFRRYRNVLSRASRSANTWIFDFHFTTGAGKSRSTHRQTVFVLESKDLDVPAFECEPGGWIASFIHNTFNDQKDIDFKGDPEFSKRYVLHASDEPACRRLFESSGIRTVFANEKDLHLQGGGSVFAIFRRRRLVEPHRLLDFIRLGEQIHGFLR